MSLSVTLGNIPRCTTPVFLLSAAHEKMCSSTYNMPKVCEILMICGAAIVGTLHAQVKPLHIIMMQVISTVSALRK